MNFKFRVKRMILRWQEKINRKTKLLPDQQIILNNWVSLLRDKNAKPYYCRVRDERVVALFDDEQEQILRKMMILRDNGPSFYEMLYTEHRADGSITIIDTELDPKIAKIFVDRFDETIYRKIVNLGKLRKNLMNASMVVPELKPNESALLQAHQEEINISKTEDSKLLSAGIKMTDTVKNN